MGQFNSPMLIWLCRDVSGIKRHDAPIEQLPGSPTIKLILNGEVLDQFPGARNIEKEYVVPVAKQGNNPNSELRITTDKTLVPKEKDPKSNDGRVLGLSVRKIVWEAK